MKILAKLKDWKNKREAQQELRIIQNVSSAKEKIEKLQTRKRTLEEREKIFRQREQLESELRNQEKSVKELDYKQRNPLISSIKKNVQEKIAKNKAKSNPNKTTGFVGGQANPFTSNSQSSGFLKTLQSNSSSNYFSSSSQVKKTRRNK